MTEQEERILNKAKEKIIEQQNLLKRLTAPSYHLGTIIADSPSRVVVDIGSQVLELDKVESSLNLKVGQSVDVHPETGQIVKVSEFVSYGATGTVTAIDDDLIQITVPSGIITTTHALIPVAVDDKVVLNASGHVILRKLEATTKYAFKTQAVLSWDDIGACGDAKAEMIAALETPYTEADLFSFFNKKQVKGALLWGRAGNGKTLLGRAAAGSLARIHGKESAESGFLYIKGPELLDKFVGESEARIREAFKFGKEHFKRHGYPCVLFVDEADALLMRRGSRTASGMEMTIVPQFLSEMDGIEDSGVFVLLASNRADVLDPAIIRPGRIDRKIYIAPPTKENAPEIWNIHMRRVPVSGSASKEQLVETTNNMLYSEQFPLYNIDTPNGRSIFSLGNLVSGALIAGIVERASAIAISRNEVIKAANPKKFVPEGLLQADFDTALTAMHKEQFGMNHFDELREFMDLNKIDQNSITSIEQCHDGVKMERPAAFAAAASRSAVLVPLQNQKGGYDA